MLRNFASSERRSVRRWTALVTAGALVTLSTSVFASPAAVAAGAPGITAAKTAPASVLAGEPIPFVLSASNPSSNTSAAMPRARARRTSS